MADINESALLILNEDRTKFLVDHKSKEDVTSQWLMPGGSIEAGESVEESLAREVGEELNCQLDVSTVKFVGEYEAPAAGLPGKIVNIKLYSGSIVGQPVPNSEIVALGWLGKNDRDNQEVSEIIREKIIPDLLERGILLS
ncbi:DNA mismatch repair protein MutT [Candidatus Uhrbacteria bacterium CG_4_10_14_0_8_um_filter_58_22]|uniref:DNA mismatch repair protein MutT n=1 Tax=Candidatus Uhrbacteria bacterium CG_4_10_14_0_8_um_filter_58_22 TaxID=1975029 RepID=A0A2M7QAV6_9BACT|nr:MAG: hypothetical protein AUJ19_04210 [Parcubacteria group bacterium CG1_02_58_44]PIY63298.1 MAG: DNA mismatch repair protein MutT [Candidatus Uhrbacteria bacterium CG_4_10_14_0_8_um_filter_58_22]